MAATTEAPATRTATVTPERIMELRLPLDVDVAPPGDRLAFTVAAGYTKPGERPRQDIWISAVDGLPEQATFGSWMDTYPRFSPDGGMVAFASDRDHAGRLSLYLIGAGPGEAKPIGDLAGSVEDIQWSPDGRQLLVLAADIGSDRAGAQSATKIEEVGAAEQDPKVTRPFQAWRRLFLVDVASGDTEEVGPERVQIFEFDWSGDRAVAVCADEPSESAWYDAYVAVLDLEARTAEVVHRPQWQLQAPRISPDGRSIAFVEGFCSDRGILAGPVMLLELGGGGGVRPLADDVEAAWLKWRDDRTLWFAGWRGLGSRCGTVTLDGRVEELLEGAFTLGTRSQPRISVSEDGRTVATILDGPHDPPEVVLVDGRGARKVSSLNGETAAPLAGAADWQAYEWRAADGLEIEGLLALPPDRGSDALPLVVLVHGGPTAAWSWQFAPYRGLPLLLASAGYAVLLPNPRGSRGRGEEFARMNLGDMGGEDLRDILAGVDALVEDGTADDDRVGIIGGSYGGFMSAWAATQTDRFRASIPQAVVSNWLSFHNTTNIGQFDVLFLDSDPYDPGGEYPKRSPVYHARSCKTPTLVMHGQEDLCTPIGQAQELHQALVEAGCETELVVYPREGHGWSEWDHQVDAWNRIKDWFDTHLAPRSGGS